MSLRSLGRRLDRLGAGRRPAGGCDGPATAWVLDAGVSVTVMGDGLPFDPARAARCRRCGEAHVAVTREKVVRPGGTTIPSRVYHPG